MDSFLIEGPAQIKGAVEVSGSKNSALPLLFAALLFDNEVYYENVPRLWDVETALKLMNSMGVESDWDKETGKVCLRPQVRKRVAPYEWVRQMRAGILALGPLVAKYGEAKVSLPGGCAIGARPVNFHLDAFEKMGVQVEVQGGVHSCEGSQTYRWGPYHFSKSKRDGNGEPLVFGFLCGRRDPH